MLESIGFGAFAALAVSSALAIVLWRNLVHSVLWLALLLLSTAGIFIVLGAPFIGGIQVMLYAGGVVTLMLFAVMLTRRRGGVAIQNEVAPGRRLPALLASTGLFGSIAWAVSETPNLPEQPAEQVTTKDLGRAFLTDQVLAFEALSVLLLAATIGAIVLARRRDHGAPSTSTVPQRYRSARKGAA